MIWESKEEINDIAAKGAAYQLTELFGFTEPKQIVLEDIAMVRGVLVIEGALEGAEARLVRRGEHGIIRVKKALEVGRKRFAIAHEMGHWELHKDVLSEIYSENTIKGYGSTKIEIEANIFASELLMPTNMFRPKCVELQPSFQSIKRLADEFATSLTAATVRFVDETEYSCAVVFSERGKISWWRKSRSCEEIWFERQQEIREGSLAWDCLAGKDASQLEGTVDAEAWVNEAERYEITKVFEQSILLAGHSVVMSLIWI